VLGGSLSEFPGWTPANVKLLLPPRQSRGNSRCISTMTRFAAFSPAPVPQLICDGCRSQCNSASDANPNRTRVDAVRSGQRCSSSISCVRGILKCLQDDENGFTNYLVRHDHIRSCTNLRFFCLTHFFQKCYCFATRRINAFQCS
jgi:hypothetical protein